MCYLVIGNGILGSVLTNNYSNFKSITRKDLDITWPLYQIETVINNWQVNNICQIDGIINTAAFTQVDLAEDETHVAKIVNSYGPAKLAQICRKLNIPLIHISTDFIFDGKISRKKGYIEEDTPNPVNYYGYTKLLGEQLIKESGCKYVIVRTGKLYNKTDGFIHKIINKLTAETRICAVRNQTFSPTHAISLAKQLYVILRSEILGTFHATDWNFCTAYELIDFIAKTMNIQVNIDEESLFIQISKAQRPEFCVLSHEKLESFGLYCMPSWQTDVINLLKKGSNGDFSKG